VSALEEAVLTKGQAPGHPVKSIGLGSWVSYLKKWLAWLDTNVDVKMLASNENTITLYHCSA